MPTFSPQSAANQVCRLLFSLSRHRCRRQCRSGLSSALTRTGSARSWLSPFPGLHRRRHRRRWDWLGDSRRDSPSDSRFVGSEEGCGGEGPTSVGVGIGGGGSTSENPYLAIFEGFPAENVFRIGVVSLPPCVLLYVYCVVFM